MIIDEPVFVIEVEWDFPSRFCEYEALWKDKRICTAHLHEGRVFTREKVDMQQAKSSPAYCADARPPEKKECREDKGTEPCREH